MATNIQDYLGIFPQDCSSQQIYFERLKQYFRSLEDIVTYNDVQNIFVCQSTEPTQADWELAWVSQTSEPLPIPPSADLYWLSQDCTVTLGVYGTVEGSVIVANRIGNKPTGTSLLLSSNFDNVDVTFDAPIGAIPYFSATLIVPIKSTLVMECQTWGYISTGPSGPYAIDFLLDGERVGVELLGIDPGDGISKMFQSTSALNTPGNLGAVAIMPNVEAGEHSFSVVAGYLNTGSAGAYLSQSSATIVRGYAE